MNNTNQNKSAFSKSYVEKAERSIRFTPLWFKMKLSRYIGKIRQYQRLLRRQRQPVLSAKPEITANLERAATHFQTHNWAYIQNILSEEFHKEVIENWPKKFYFDPPNTLAKSYDAGFHWNYGRSPDFRRFDPYNQNPIVAKFLNYLRAPEFSKRISNFVGINKEFTCYSLTMNQTLTGTQVIPHKDGIQDDPRKRADINIVFFINGTGGKNSGNLSLFQDREGEQSIVEPDNLKNSCLIYDTMADFYHGFKPVERGKFRWAIISEFCEKSFVEKA